MVSPAHDVARRQFLAGLAALGAGALLPAREAEAQMSPSTAHRIDVHHHHTPPPYLVALTARNVPGPVRDWTPEKSIADMDAAGVATAHPRRTGLGHRVVHRHHADDRQPGVQRCRRALPRPDADLLPRRRHAAVPDRALHAPAAGERAARRAGAGRRRARAQALLL